MSKFMYCPYCGFHSVVPFEDTNVLECVKCGQFFVVIGYSNFRCEYCKKRKPTSELASADEFICHDCRQDKLYNGEKSRRRD